VIRVLSNEVPARPARYSRNNGDAVRIALKRCDDLKPGAWERLEELAGK
jgi:hypothetical protein